MGLQELLVTINGKIISSPLLTLKFLSPTIFLLYESGGKMELKKKKMELTETNIKFYFTVCAPEHDGVKRLGTRM